MSPRETSREIERQAAQWVARVDRGPLPTTEQSNLEAWLADDVRRMGAYARLSAVFAQTEAASALGRQFDPSALARRSDDSVRTRRKVLWAGGAAAALAACWPLGERLLRPEISTAKGQILRVPLPDGSSVTLNTASRIVAAFDLKVRRVHLNAGEALFEVAKDATRPFIVEAGRLRVRAVGTVFSVTRGASAQVMVREGIVDVSGPGVPRRTRLGVNAILALPATGGPPARSAVGEQEVERRLAWRDGLLAFEGESLGQAAAAFERYSEPRIVIDDPGLAREPISGLFSIADPKGFARTAATSFDARVTNSGDTIHLLR